jgi:hypothetical protein
MTSLHRYLCTLLILVSWGQRAPGQTILKTNLLAPIIGGASLAVEVAAPAHKSVVVDASFGKTSLALPYDQYTFQSIQTQLRFYRKSPGPMRGSYLSPYAKYMHRQLYQEGRPGSWLFPGKAYRLFEGHSAGLGFSIGRQGVLAKRLIMDLSIGAGYLFYVSQQTQGTSSDQTGHVDMNVGISLGYSSGRSVSVSTSR